MFLGKTSLNPSGHVHRGVSRFDIPDYEPTHDVQLFVPVHVRHLDGQSLNIL